MTHGVRIITVCLAAWLAGAASLAESVAAEYATAEKVPLAPIQQPHSVIRTAAVDDVGDREADSPADAERPEPLPPTEPEVLTVAPLTLADVEGLALQSNPTLAAAAARMRAASGRQVQAGLYPNPIIGYHATEIGNQGMAGQQGGFVAQRFITGGKRKLDQAIAGKEVTEKCFQLRAQEQRVLTDVRVRFFEAFIAQRRLMLTTQLAQIGDDLVSATDRLLQGKLGTENDLLQAQIRAEQSHILHDNAHNESIEAWRRLAAVMGIPTMQATPLVCDLKETIPDLDWQQCYALVLGSNLDLSAARAHAQRANLVIQRARKEPIPNVDLSVSVRHHNVSSDDVANVQVGIPIPVFDKNQGNICAAEAEWIAACRELERIELELQDRLAVAYRRFANARQQAERYSSQIVPLAKRSLELVTDGYEMGQVEYLTLLTAQQTYYQVSLSELDSLREVWAASAIIEGQLLTGSLQSPPKNTE